MSAEILYIAAAVVTIGGACVAIGRWIWSRINSPATVQAHTKLPLWDVAVIDKDGNPEATVVARLTVAGETKEEAGDRVKQLVEQWNQVSLGFEILTGKTIPNDDEEKPLNILRPDHLPQYEGDLKALTVSMEKREPPGFPGVALFKKIFCRKSE